MPNFSNYAEQLAAHTKIFPLQSYYKKVKCGKI